MSEISARTAFETPASRATAMAMQQWRVMVCVWAFASYRNASHRPPSPCFGAQVRAIPSSGDVFLHGNMTPARASGYTSSGFQHQRRRRSISIGTQHETASSTIALTED